LKDFTIGAEFYFKCVCDALDLPIGFELKANVYGLDICYELPPDESVADLAKKGFNKRSGFQPGPIDPDTQNALTSQTSHRGANETTSTMKTFQSHKHKKNTPMVQLEFLDLNINEPGNSSFIIKNMSGIPTYFRLRFDKFESPYQAANQNNVEKSVGGTSKANSNLLKKSMTKNFSMTTDFSIKGKTKTGGIMARPKLLDDKIEKVGVFSSNNGMQATKVKIQRNEAQNHLQNKKGIALVCKPNEGV
jgi:hypothetical protein